MNLSNLQEESLIALFRAARDYKHSYDMFQRRHREAIDNCLPASHDAQYLNKARLAERRMFDSIDEAEKEFD